MTVKSTGLTLATVLLIATPACAHVTLDGRPAAVDIDHRAVHEASLVAGQVDRGVSDRIRRPASAGRSPVHHVLSRVPAAVGPIGIGSADHTGRDGVDPYAS